MPAEQAFIPIPVAIILFPTPGGPIIIIGTDVDKKGFRSNEQLAKQVGESVNQIKRYIRLTYLIPKILDMVDEGKIAFTIAVELSYLKEEEQYELHAVMDLEQCTPSLSQANRLKRMSQKGELDMVQYLRRRKTESEGTDQDIIGEIK